METDIVFPILSFFTFLTLLILLFMLIKFGEQNEENVFFITISISEMLNCLPKFLQMIRYNKNDIFCYFQIFFSITSDICTLSTTTLMSLKSYYQLAKDNNCFRKEINQKIIKVICIIFPLFISVFFTLFDLFEKNEDNPHNTKEICWINNKICNRIIYLIFWILIITNFIFIIISICSLRIIKNKFKSFENDLLEGETVSEEKKKNLPSNKVENALCESYIYSIIIPIIWVYFTFSRLFTSNSEKWMYVHRVISCLRGLIYVSIYSFLMLIDGLLQNKKILFMNLIQMKIQFVLKK